jgi:bacillithiol system protein YtxJ
MAVSWKNITSVAQLDAIEEESHEHPVILFKHSTQCAVSAMAKTRFEGNSGTGNEVYYYLDLLRFRDISNAIAEKFQVHHQSPQVILLKNGKVIFDESHMAISFEEIQEQITTSN